LSSGFISPFRLFLNHTKRTVKSRYPGGFFIGRNEDMKDENFLQGMRYSVKRLQAIAESQEESKLKEIRASVQLSQLLRLVGEHLPTQEQQLINQALDLYGKL
jgi:hypothetical protein